MGMSDHSCRTLDGAIQLRQRRLRCDPREESIPCPLHLVLEQLDCPSAPALLARERVAVGNAFIFALQSGSNWSSQFQGFVSPSIISAESPGLETALFPTVRRRRDMLQPPTLRM